jgi:GT2 family glycosyltransferase
VQDATSSVSVVIVTWCSEGVLGRCLDALAAHAPSVPHEVVVVDNASTDRTVEVARSRPGVRVLRQARNLGLAAGNNVGISATGGEAVLICNPDAIVGPGAIDALLGLLGRHPRAAIAVPRLRYEDGALQTSVGDLPTLREVLAGRQAQRRRAATEGFWWDGWGHDEERRVGRGHEACYLVRRSAIDDVGGQDERFRLDYEGIDWTERMRRAGWEVWFTPEAEVTHLGGDSARRVPLRWVLRQHLGMYRYFALRRPLWARPALAVLFAGRAALKLLGLLVGATGYERSHRSATDSSRSA